MPYLKCRKCHHEFEGKEDEQCDWCGADTSILEKETPLEKMCKNTDEIIEILQEINKKYDKTNNS